MNKEQVLRQVRNMEAIAIANMLRGNKNLYNHFRELSFVAERQYAEIEGVRPTPAVLHTVEDCDRVLAQNNLPNSKTMTIIYLLDRKV